MLSILLDKGREVVTGQQTQITRTQERLRQSIVQLKDIKRKESGQLRQRVVQLQKVSSSRPRPFTGTTHAPLRTIATRWRSCRKRSWQRLTRSVQCVPL